MKAFSFALANSFIFFTIGFDQQKQKKKEGEGPRGLQGSKLHSATVKHVGKSKGVLWGFSFGVAVLL